MKNSDLIIKKITNWKKRKLIKQITNESKLKIILEKKLPVYCGIDPTSDSLHLGHLVPLTLLKEISDFGCKPIIIIGTATGQIGDPSFRKEKRFLLNEKEINENKADIIEQIKKILPNALILENHKWYQAISLLDFMKEIGHLFTINKILERESLSEALNRDALFYSNFSYILMQAYDFYYLWKNYKCALQIGGSDQLPNIVFGIDLIKRRTENFDSILAGITTSLLTTKNNQKISKTLNQGIWLSEKKNSFYDFYQFIYKMNDQIAEEWLQIFVHDISDQKIIELKSDPKKRLLQWNLLKNLVIQIHSLKRWNELENSFAKINQFFNKKDLNELKSFQKILKIFEFDCEVPLWKIVLETNLVTSKNQALTLIKGKGIKINFELIIDPFKKMKSFSNNKDSLILLQKSNFQIKLLKKI